MSVDSDCHEEEYVHRQGLYFMSHSDVCALKAQQRERGLRHGRAEPSD